MAFFVALALAAAIPPHQTLEAAVVAYDAAQASGDKQALERLLASDYALVNSGGEVENKAEFIADLTDPTYHLNPFHVIGPIKRTWTGAAIRGGVSHLTGQSGGKAFDACLRFVDIWRRRDGFWQVAYSQAARAKDAACSGQNADAK